MIIDVSCKVSVVCILEAKYVRNSNRRCIDRNAVDQNASLCSPFPALFIKHVVFAVHDNELNYFIIPSIIFTGIFCFHLVDIFPILSCKLCTLFGVQVNVQYASRIQATHVDQVHPQNEPKHHHWPAQLKIHQYLPRFHQQHTRDNHKPHLTANTFMRIPKISGQSIKFITK